MSTEKNNEHITPEDTIEEHITPEDTIEEQVRDQTGQTKVRVRIDESSIKTSYASGFRPAATPEEVVLDFGMNITRMTGQKDVMNYYATKRLAIALSQLIRKYEDQFGELELNASKRKKS